MDSLGTLMDLPGATLNTLTPTERRLSEEWALLEQMVQLNPTRLSHAEANDTTFYVTLSATPALPLSGTGRAMLEHRLRVVYPRFFPAVPMELYLEQAVCHPNIHPLTGFVCLWESHRLEYTVEHALHRTAAILGWQLLNVDPRHVMQPEALALNTGEWERRRAELRVQLRAPALEGLPHEVPTFAEGLTSTSVRRRLS